MGLVWSIPVESVVVVVVVVFVVFVVLKEGERDCVRGGTAE